MLGGDCLDDLDVLRGDPGTIAIFGVKKTIAPRTEGSREIRRAEAARDGSPTREQLPRDGPTRMNRRVAPARGRDRQGPRS